MFTPSCVYPQSIWILYILVSYTSSLREFQLRMPFCRTSLVPARHSGARNATRCQGGLGRRRSTLHRECPNCYYFCISIWQTSKLQTSLEFLISGRFLVLTISPYCHIENFKPLWKSCDCNPKTEETSRWRRRRIRNAECDSLPGSRAARQPQKFWQATVRTLTCFRFHVYVMHSCPNFKMNPAIPIKAFTFVGL